jgi:hypothetical protein
MKYGLYIKKADDGEWMRESDKSISLWDNIKEANDWRKNHTVFPERYIVKEVTAKIIKEDMNATQCS